MTPPIHLEKQCAPKCRSRQHVDQITSQIARLSLLEFQAFSWLCHNWSKHPDLLGRMALHIAASCGKTEILEWLLEEKKVDLSVKDAESGYTALHRAIYYGQIAAAKILIQYDSDLQVCDHEGLTPLDAAIFDRPGFISYSITEPNEVWTWGENMNSILGHHSTHKRTNPDIVSEFRDQGLSMKQVVVSKYHCVFLTQDGRVFTCGNGQGGRLGHGDQHFVLVPKMVESIKSQTCVEIAAGTDHTLMRMRRGLVLSCGLNTCHQLGQGQGLDEPSCLLPRQMKSKFLKKKPILGICAGRFHSVVWAADEIYTVGLNAGQLGHPKGDKYIDQLQSVPSLRSSSSIEILAVSCSDAATACLTAKGHVFVLHEYQCKRIALRLSGIEQISVTGGSLDNYICSDMLMEKGGHELMLAVRNKCGQVYMWRESSPSVKRCRWKLKRQLTVTDVSINQAGLIVTTAKGQAYMGKLSSRKTGAGNQDVIKESPKETYKLGGDVEKQPRLLDFMLKEEVEDVAPIRIPGVHRALSVACDKRGRNFGVIQALPNGCVFKFPNVSSSVMNENIRRLLVEADEGDILHDVVIQVDDRRWPVHRYIISSRSDYFYHACQDLGKSDDNISSVPVIKMEDMTPDLMDQIIQYMYTDTCDLMSPGYQVKLNLRTANPRDDKQGRKTNNMKNNKMEEDVGLDRQTSAFVVEQKRKKSGKGKESHQSKDPVKILQEATQKLGIKNLSERLNQVRCTDGVISLDSPLDKDTFHFDRLSFIGLSDVTIVTADDKEIPCHKCILASRLEYFYSMFATGWVESKQTTCLTFPVPGEAFEILIDYIYTDEAQQLVDCSDVKLLYEVMVLSDQLLSRGLKELCEVALANIVSFKNVSEFLEFSSVYNADQLKETCQQFVSFNLSAVLEARIMEVLSEETLQELTDYYRSTMPNVAYRVLTPSSDILDQTYLDSLVAEYQNQDSNPQDGTSESTRKSTSAKKRAKRIKSVSESDGHQSIQPIISSDNPSQSRRRSRQMSIGSDVGGKSEDVAVTMMEWKDKHVGEDNTTAAPKTRGSDKTARQKDSMVSAMPTHPEDVPIWTSKMKTLTTSHQLDTDDKTDHISASQTLPSSPVPPSLSSPTPPPLKSPTIPTAAATSLRDIMRNEFKTNRSELKHNDAKKKKDGKKQDKKENKPVVAKSPTCPWGTVSGVVSGVISSFRDLMLQDQTQHEPGPAAAKGHTGHTGTPASTKSSRHPRSAPIAIPHKASGTQPTSPRGDNPWQKGQAQWSSPPSFLSCSTSPPPLLPSRPSPATAKVNFTDIMQDEMEKEATLVKMRQKPLTLIQMEEKAMQDLLQHYHASERVDDFVTVERVTKHAVATPVWQRD